ncbi:hypothetical protein HYQ45_010345 [Verticillium longisporum]|uniref:Asl1-like glycosyl hydrolase catalytic domain-containing protein n=1 Tax=Verticillium longisporum TaxID=100787 RepID=A0A8I2ZIA2_VERLO|nr:hypothetical protein HYQ45_010345 [Verticillium longisporum]
MTQDRGAVRRQATTPRQCHETQVLGYEVSRSHRKRWRGLAYNAAELVRYFFTGGNTCASFSWAYNWDSRDNGLVEEGLEFVPMLRGPIEDPTRRWRANAEDMLAKGSAHILSFNECDIASQYNTSSAEAAHAHVEFMNLFSPRVRIGSPAVFNGNVAGEGPGLAPGAGFRICGGRPVWLTEFALAPLSPDDEDAVEWLREVLPLLEGMEHLEQ